jgi:hypothetical protein
MGYLKRGFFRRGNCVDTLTGSVPRYMYNGGILFLEKPEHFVFGSGADPDMHHFWKPHLHQNVSRFRSRIKTKSQIRICIKMKPRPM